jgi:hypothetical protein
VSWRKFEFAAPELAALGSARLTGRIAYFATIRADGAPRVHNSGNWFSLSEHPEDEGK